MCGRPRPWPWYKRTASAAAIRCSRSRNDTASAFAIFNGKTKCAARASSRARPFGSRRAKSGQLVSPKQKRAVARRLFFWDTPRTTDPTSIVPGSSSDPRDVLGCRSLLALNQIELDRFAFRQGLEAVPQDRRVMHEAIALSVGGGDEAKAFGVVKPLHRSGGPHEVLLFR